MKNTMRPHSDLEIKSRLVLGLGLLSLVVVLLLRLLLPVLIVGGLGVGGYWLWRQWQNQRQKQQRRQTRLNAKFYQLLRQQQGRISVLDFAMSAKLEGTAAQAYLNDQAQAFSAYFETTGQGDIIYVFNLAVVQGGQPPGAQTYPQAAQAEAAWAYAEQTRARQARAEQAQSAWASAKQIRTLRQLSQCDLKQKAAAQGERPAHSPARSVRLPHEGIETVASAGKHESPNALSGERLDESEPSSTILRERASEAPDAVVTIDVSAVQG